MNIPVLIPGDMFFTSRLSEISGWGYTRVSLKQVAIRFAQGQTCGLKTFSRFRAFSGLITLQLAIGDTETEPIQSPLKDVSGLAL